MRLLSGNLYQRVSLFALSFVLAVSSLSAAVPLYFSQMVNATPVGNIYDGIPNTQPAAYTSLGYAATSTSGFGDRLILDGTNRQLNSVTVSFTSWACESGGWNTHDCVTTSGATFAHDMTVNLYETTTTDTVGNLIVSKTQTINAKYRPSADNINCTGANVGKWYNGTGCYNGIAFDAVFDFSGLNTVLPDNLIAEVAYNTSHYGANPIGATGAYDSLNVSLTEVGPTTGTDYNTDVMYWDTTYPGYTAGLKADSGWSPYHLAIDIYATPVTTTGTSFVSSPKYVRVNNVSDLAAQIVTPDTTTGVRFFVDGDTDTPISGNNIGGAGATTSWWRLYTPLASGQHSITGEIEIYGNWYPIVGSGTVYSIDLPWAQYILPQAGQYFQSNDKVVRVKADDEFNQFKEMKTTFNGTTYTINRSSCSDQGSYVLCDLQGLNLPEGTYAASTTTYTIANNRVDNLVSASFVVDNTRPSLSNFNITDVHSVYNNNIALSADAFDANGIDNVTYYVTAPRAGDGVCDGNGASLATVQGTLANGMTYTGTLDTSGLNGSYCLNAIAEDVATNHSNPILHTKVTIDNVVPGVPSATIKANNINVPNEGYTNSKTFTFNISSSADATRYRLKYWNDIPGSPFKENTPWNPSDLSGYSSSLGVYNDQFTQGEGTHYFAFSACDAAGNCSAYSAPFVVTYDKTAPVSTITTPGNGDTVKGEVIISGSVIDINPHHYYLVIKNSANQVVAGPGTVNSATVADYSWDTTKLPDGVYTINLESRDAAGNKGAASTMKIQVTVDNTNPIVSITNLIDGASFGNNSVVSVLGTTDDAVEYELFIDDLSADTGLAFAGYDWNTTGVASGDYIVRLEATDASGNMGFDEITVTVDNTAPIITYTDITQNEKDFTPNITVDDGSAVPTWTADLSNPAGVTFDDTLLQPTFTVVNDGTYKFTLTVTDGLGNSSSQEISFDYEAPELEGDTVQQTSRALTTPAAQPVTTDETDNADNAGQEKEVLGEQDTKSDNSDDLASANSDVKGDSTTNDSTWMIIGLAWYWWLLILAALGGTGWWFMAGWKKRKEAE